MLFSPQNVKYHKDNDDSDLYRTHRVLKGKRLASN
jgi:hypothetical protein